ncbi:vWA domain-containing protein [Reichenbachiella versicolor]|uniref:vWA domain-containing protein n=1 Tax=Reichenbachiella versicolor TaxID=1821036 RepID=UPI000D6E11E7|nr:von Willebrand factor type A domain-containing protein [Reichenbachiella versicolor]
MKLFSIALAFIALLVFSCEELDESASFGEDGYFSDVELGDQYSDYGENPFVKTVEQSVSTFSIDADGASYANVRRFITQDQQLPPLGAVRTEELINYFDLGYSHKESEHPISLNNEISECPWNTEHRLLRIGIQGESIDLSSTRSNYVFLIDVSGSMAAEDKLDLLKAGFTRLVDELHPEDRIAIVTYAGAAEILLRSTPVSEKNTIVSAISKLGAGGGTAGAEGIVTAYEIATDHFIEGGNNRIVLGSDGDFNIGISDQEELVQLLEEKRESGIFITILGVGRGNLNDSVMEQMANHGNGTYEYIDNIEQLKKVFML